MTASQTSVRATLEVDALIERLEKATGPSRLLEVDIARAIGWSMVPGDGLQPLPDWLDPLGNLHVSPPYYTLSIDAALTLLPELNDLTRPLDIRLRVSENGKWFSCAFVNWKWGVLHSGNCASYAIAVCIPALKARKEAAL